MSRTAQLGWILLLLATGAAAGDLDQLPSSEQAFASRIGAFIRPGGKLADALSLLEAHRFVCREFNNKNPVIHCGRTDSAVGGRPRFYQVMIETSGGRIRSVEPATGLIRD